LLRTILYAVGIRAIDVSEDGVTGFGAFCRLEYDLVFTDYEMEPISGLDLVDMIRTSRKRPNPYVPVIIIFSYSDEERVQDARDRGVTEFLAKPFTVDVLMPRLESVIEEPRPFVRTGGYFGPARRRKQDKRYKGPERWTTELEQVKVSVRDLSEQQRNALEESRANAVKIAAD
jgi:two-component system chemotaxis response regulator CheY